jgi:hypothetical protein
MRVLRREMERKKQMAEEERTGTGGSDGFRKALVPAALGIAGSVVAAVVRNRPKKLQEAIPKVRDAVPQLPERGVGHITDDLRGRLESVLRRRGDEGEGDGAQAMRPKSFDTSGIEKRRAERRERREQRRRRSDT